MKHCKHCHGELIFRKRVFQQGSTYATYYCPACRKGFRYVAEDHKSVGRRKASGGKWTNASMSKLFDNLPMFIEDEEPPPSSITPEQLKDLL